MKTRNHTRLLPVYSQQVLKVLHQVAYNCIFAAQRQIPTSVFCQVMEHYFDELAGDIDSINSGWSLRRSTLRSKLTRARISMWELARQNP